MKILLADPDRDFLMSFKKLLELDSHDVTAAFDGTQVINYIANIKFDIVILRRNIPRVSSKQIVKTLNHENIPVIMLIDKKISSAMLIDQILANSYLSFPFLPYELKNLIENIKQKSQSEKHISFCDVEVDVEHFSLSDGTRLTNEEIDILGALSRGQSFEVRRANSYINSLNNKLGKLNKKTHIKYVLNEGYRLVTDNE